MKAAARAAGARRALSLLLCLAALVFSQGCGEVQSEPVRVVASSFGGYSLAKAVAGEHAVVNLMSTQDDDPHGYRPDAFSIANLACADLLITMGEDIDTWLPELRRDIDRAQTAVLDLSAEGDPHRLLLPREAAAVALEVAQQLKTLDEQHGEDYEAAAQQLSEQLEALDQRLVEALAPGFSFAVAGANPYGCLEELPGVVLVAAREGCDEETEQWDEQLLERAREAGVQLLLFNERDDADEVQALSQELGVPALYWHALHMVPQKEREEGVTLLSLLEQTVTELEKYGHQEDKGE